MPPSGLTAVRTWGTEAHAASVRATAVVLAAVIRIIASQGQA